MPQPNRPPGPQDQLPPIPDQPRQEGGRWRFHRPSSEQVAAWFRTQPLDDEMEHDHYVGGVVLIPQNEKVTYTTPRGKQDRYENVWTPYVQIGTRIAYFRRLAEVRELIPVIEPVEVWRVTNPSSGYFNANMPIGYWYHVVPVTDGPAVKYLCCTMRCALYRPTEYAERLNGKPVMAVISGESTKQVAGGPNIDQLAKAQTGAIGRALGVAGILTLGTGVATAEDLQELAGPAGTVPVGPASAELPPVEVAGVDPGAVDPAQQRDEMLAKAGVLQARLQEEKPEAWREFVAWWNEQRATRGWSAIGDVPSDALRGIVSRMERALVS